MLFLPSFDFPRDFLLSENTWKKDPDTPIPPQLSASEPWVFERPQDLMCQQK